MPIFIKDPLAYFNQLDREQAKWLNSLPKCSICNEPIQQERAFEKNGFWICDECFEDNRREVNVA